MQHKGEVVYREAIGKPMEIHGLIHGQSSLRHISLCSGVLENRLRSLIITLWSLLGRQTAADSQGKGQ